MTVLELFLRALLAFLLFCVERDEGGKSNRGRAGGQPKQGEVSHSYIGLGSALLFIILLFCGFVAALLGAARLPD